MSTQRCFVQSRSLTVRFSQIHAIVILFPNIVPFPFSSFSPRTSPTPRTTAPGTASRPWPPSCLSCLGNKRTVWNCTIRTGIHPQRTHQTRPRETSKLKCEEMQTIHAHLNHRHELLLRNRHTHRHSIPEKIYIGMIYCIGSQTFCSLPHAMCFVGSYTVFVYRWRGHIW